MTETKSGAFAPSLSKSKVMAWRQCERRLWLEVKRPEARADSDAAQAAIQAGYAVGDVARRIFDPAGAGRLVDAQAGGHSAALRLSTDLLRAHVPVFEPGFSGGGALAYADVMLPAGGSHGAPSWHLVEVKSSTSVKDYHLDDVAVQAYAAASAGVRLKTISIAHVDSGWTYGGDGDYRGLLHQVDVTDATRTRHEEVASWIDAAQGVLRSLREPRRTPGPQCAAPYECGYLLHCTRHEPVAEYPVQWLPRVQSRALKDHLAKPGVRDMRQVPDELLNEQQRRVKSVTLSGRPWFDAEGARRALLEVPEPLTFLDFETVSLPVPIWKGTRPYQQVPFQFSVHRLGRTGRLVHDQFLDLSGDDPRPTLALALLDACGEHGAVLAYFASFERSRIEELAAALPRLRARLLALAQRIVDLLPVTRDHWYHPSQQGSWSIKAVLPTLAPGLDYEMLEGVQHGGAAVQAWLEAVHPSTSPARREEIRRQLLAYCRLDTYAMVRVWGTLAGRQVGPDSP
jgi:hypothetical protein